MDMATDELTSSRTQIIALLYCKKTTVNILSRTFLYVTIPLISFIQALSHVHKWKCCLKIEHFAAEFGRIMQNNGNWQPHCSSLESRSFKITLFGANRKPICDYLLMKILTCIISLTVCYCRLLVKFALSTRGYLSLTHSFGMNP